MENPDRFFSSQKCKSLPDLNLGKNRISALTETTRQNTIIHILYEAQTIVNLHVQSVVVTILRLTRIISHPVTDDVNFDLCRDMHISLCDLISFDFIYIWYVNLSSLSSAPSPFSSVSSSSSILPICLWYNSVKLYTCILCFCKHLPPIVICSVI